MNFEEIEKLQIGKKADFTSELKNNSKDYSFHCKKCDSILKISALNSQSAQSRVMLAVIIQKKMNKIIAIAIDEYFDPTIDGLKNCSNDINLLIDTLSNSYLFDSIELYAKPEQAT